MYNGLKLYELVTRCQCPFSVCSSVPAEVALELNDEGLGDTYICACRPTHSQSSCEDIKFCLGISNWHIVISLVPKNICINSQKFFLCDMRLEKHSTSQLIQASYLYVQGMASPEIPSEMHAWTHTSRGPPTRVLHLVSNVPVRHPKTASEILVKVSYAALNPGGAIMMHFVPFILRHSPAVPEMDFSGVVVELGPATENDSLTGGAQESSFKVGDRVFGSIEVPTHVGGGHGALAEYVVVNPKHCCRAPANAKMEELAGLGIAGTTALRLIKTAEPWLKPGAKVLVNGASGGIGSLVVQLAKNVVGDSGLVVAVCSARNRDLVLGLGPDAVS